MNKYFRLLVLLIMFCNYSFAQTYTEKWNSLYERYELRDNNGNLIGHKKWNSLYNRYDIEYTNKTSYNNTYVKPYDFELINSTLIYKQNKYDSNKDKITNKANYINGLFEFLFDKKSEPEVENRFDEFVELWKAFMKHCENIRFDKLDLSSNNTTNQVLSNLNTYESKIKSLISTIQAERNETIDRMNQVIKHYNTSSNYPSSIKNGWHKVYSMNRKDFCEIRKVYVDNNKITKYALDNSEMLEIEFGNLIQACRTSIKLKNNDDFLDIYFLEYLSNTN